MGKVSSSWRNYKANYNKTEKVMAIFAGMGSKPHLRFLLNKKRKGLRPPNFLFFFYLVEERGWATLNLSRLQIIKILWVEEGGWAINLKKKLNTFLKHKKTNVFFRARAITKIQANSIFIYIKKDWIFCSWCCHSGILVSSGWLEYEMLASLANIVYTRQLIIL